MAERYPDGEMGLISKGLYSKLKGIIGPECIVKLRQRNFEIRNAFYLCDSSSRLPSIISGSMAEGFDFKSSDFDMMFIDKNVIVLYNNVCFTSSISDIPSVLIMDTDDVPPGFTLLKCLRYDHRNVLLCKALVPIGNNVFVSSHIVRESFSIGGITVTHGPCKSAVFEGRDLDGAYTLRCTIWPKQAQSFIDRSLINGWPSFDMLKDICQDGCLLVPINSKKQTFVESTDLEWRISFSLAEKKLVHSMNHCQFLCYGLMKILLNEVLKKNPEICELLCSYFLKTAVFWEISEGKDEWLPWNFIQKFWSAFERVMKWVSVGYCPNFFIPEHDMFYGKIYGRHLRALMMILRKLHEERYLCFLRCTSLYETFWMLINDPFLANISPTKEDEYDLSTVMEIERTISIAVSSNAPISSCLGVKNLINYLCDISCLISTSEEMTSAIELRKNEILQRIGRVLRLNYGKKKLSQTTNRSRYWFIKVSESILRRSEPFFCRNAIHHAVYSYTNGNYIEAAQRVINIKQKLQREPFMYSYNPGGDMIMECRRHGMSYDAIIKSFVVDRYIYDPGSELSMAELNVESKSRTEESGCAVLFIPPLVFLNFLLIHSYTWLNETECRNEALCDLVSLLNDDDGHHIFCLYKAISWEILGICQQLCGDFYGAYQSYVNALNDKYNDFKQATAARLESLFM